MLDAQFRFETRFRGSLLKCESAMNNVNVRAAMIIAAAVFVGGWLGAVLANRVSGPYLRLAFGVFVVVLVVS